MRRTLAASLVLLLAAPVFAQAPGQTPPIGAPQQPPPPSAPTGPSRIDKIKHRIREQRALELSDALELDEKTAARMFTVLARYDDQFDRLLAVRGDLQRSLKSADQLKDPKALAKLIDDAVANQRALWDVEEHRLADLRAILTPQQTARLLVELPALEHKLQNQLQKAIANPKRPARRPSDDDDD